jgi:hypothetical protein
MRCIHQIFKPRTMKRTIDNNLYGMSAMTDADAMATTGGEGLLKFIGQVIGMGVAAIVSDLERMSSSKPVPIPAGQKAANSALG